MKTTVEIAPDLFERVKKRAAADGVTFKAILEAALWQMLKAPRTRVATKMPDLRVRGRGYQKGVNPNDPEQMRSFMYENARG